MTVRQPNALSASLRKHVCSPEDKWNFARMWVLHPPACAKESQTEQQAPSHFCLFPFPTPDPIPIPEGTSCTFEGLLEEQTMEYDRASLGHKGSE